MHGLRAVACFGGDRLVIVGARYQRASGAKGDRKPRPLRMKAYQHVKLDYFNTFAPVSNLPLVIVERIAWSSPLPAFKHPENAA